MLSILIPCREEKEIHNFISELEKTLPCHEIIVARDREGKGKGWALRQAFQQSKGDKIVFIDGDGEIPARMVLRLLPFLEDFDVAVGSKRITHSPLRRRIMTRVTRFWFKILFNLPFDTQTGIKLFKRKSFDLVKHWNCQSFIFDVELLYQIHKAKGKIVEVPIECELRRQLSFKTILFVFLGSVLLWLKLKIPLLKNVKFAKKISWFTHIE